MALYKPRTNDQFFKEAAFSVIHESERDAQLYDRSRRSNWARLGVLACIAGAVGGAASVQAIPALASLLTASISLALVPAAYFKAEVAGTANGEMLKAAAYARKSYNLGLLAEERGEKFERNPAVPSRFIGRNLANAVHERAKSSSSKILLAASSAVAALLFAGALVAGAPFLFGAAALALGGAGYYARLRIHSKRKAVAYENRADEIYANEIKNWDPVGRGWGSIINTPDEWDMRPIYRKIDNGVPLGPIPEFVVNQKNSGPDSGKSNLPEMGVRVLSTDSAAMILKDAGPLRLNIPRAASPIYKGAVTRPPDKKRTAAGPSSLTDAGKSRLPFPRAASPIVEGADPRLADRKQGQDGRKGRGGSV